MQYVWSKYNINESVTRSSDSFSNRGWGVYVMIGTSYTYDSSTKRYEVSGSTRLVRRYTRSYFNSGYKYLKTETCLDGGFSNIANCSSVFYIRSYASTTSNGDFFNGTEYTPIVSQSRGSYIGTVTSSSSSAYPTNGISGSYWYVKQ